MNVLVVGSGGREHAIVKALRVSMSVEKIFAWPANDGILCDAERVSVEKGKFPELIKWSKAHKIDLVIIGPEAELVAGLSDLFRASGILVFGPSQSAAQLEGSKIFAKEFMHEFGVPTARADVVTSVLETMTLAEKYSPPYVLKADGLAAGKGVFICRNLRELEAAAYTLFEEKIFGDAGRRALLEEFQPGTELSVLAITNGEEFEVMPFCRDHKRLGDDDTGPNTGGMGVIGPIAVNSELKSQITNQILIPTVRGLKARGFEYCGVIFIGLMLTAKGPQVLEYNVRFGDPETQVILPMLDGDWAELFREVSERRLPQLKWRDVGVICVVLAAENYPADPVKGAVITGVSPKVETNSFDMQKNTVKTSDVYILHAGTARKGEHFVTTGGRVLNVVAIGKNVTEARAAAYVQIQKISWHGMQYRKDIGQ